jgi:hypothetical protein
MCTFNTSSGCDCRCECDVLLREDRDLCPEHGPKEQAVPAPRRVSVGRTQALYDVSSCLSPLAKIEDIVNGAEMAGEFNHNQLGIMRWALRKCRSVASEVENDLGVEEL